MKIWIYSNGAKIIIKITVWILSISYTVNLKFQNILEIETTTVS